MITKKPHSNALRLSSTVFLPRWSQPGSTYTPSRTLFLTYYLSQSTLYSPTLTRICLFFPIPPAYEYNPEHASSVNPLPPFCHLLRGWPSRLKFPWFNNLKHLYFRSSFSRRPTQTHTLIYTSLFNFQSPLLPISDFWHALVLWGHHNVIPSVNHRADPSSS